MEEGITIGHIENEGMQKRHWQRFLRKKRCDDAARATRGGGCHANAHALTRSQQLQGNLTAAALSLSLHAQPYTRLPARAGYHRCGWNAFILSCSLCFTRQTSLPVITSFHVIMTDPTVDAPEVPILLLGDAEVGKSTFLS